MEFAEISEFAGEFSDVLGEITAPGAVEQAVAGAAPPELIDLLGVLSIIGLRVHMAAAEVCAAIGRTVADVAG